MFFVALTRDVSLNKWLFSPEKMEDHVRGKTERCGSRNERREIKHKIGETWPARERSCLRGSRLEIVSSLSTNTFYC